MDSTKPILIPESLTSLCLNKPSILPNSISKDKADVFFDKSRELPNIKIEIKNIIDINEIKPIKESERKYLFIWFPGLIVIIF